MLQSCQRRRLHARRRHGTGDLPPCPRPTPFLTTAAVFFAGVRSALTSVFFLVLAGTYIGIGALAHDFALSVWWLALSSMLVWASPAQVILVSALAPAPLPSRWRSP